METYQMKQHYNISELIVHAGNFHADDVFCAAVLKIINPDLKITRIFQTSHDKSDLEHGIVMADIGGGMFDHHQPNTPLMESGIKHCALSRLWLTFGPQLIQTIYRDITPAQTLSLCQATYDSLIRSIALMDNGISKNPEHLYTISHLIDRYLPEWNDDSDMDEAFLAAENMAEDILNREISHHYAVIQGHKIISDAIQKMKNGIIILKTTVPWEEEAVAHKEAKIIIYPSRRHEINLQLVPIAVGSFDTRIQTPKEWRGKRGDEASALVPGMTFCHMSGFLCCFEKEEQAIYAASKILEENSIAMTVDAPCPDSEITS